MTFDIYHHFKDDPRYNHRLVGHDYLFVEYKCPVETKTFEFTSELSFITFAVTGRKDWFASGKVYSINEGEAMFVRKGAYTTRQYFDVDHCLLTFFITDDFIRNFMREYNLSSMPGGGSEEYDPIFKIDVNDALKVLFYSMYNYLQMGAEIPRSLVELKFRELLFNIVLNSKNKKLAQFFATLQYVSKWSFEDVMMKHFHFDLELKDFAHLCGRSLSSFKRDFQNFYQQTPGKWLSNKRLEYAKNLLISSDMNINEICYESGFRNSSHFNKAFKDRYHHPPKQFRILCKNADIT
jgi:AraC family transcriptional regulator, exoenzyme S synthesis regulatory protein ExsA